MSRLGPECETDMPLWGLFVCFLKEIHMNLLCGTEHVYLTSSLTLSFFVFNVSEN